MSDQILSRPKQPTAFARRFGPWAVVTGASDGIGSEMAIDLARRGLNLVLVARREPLLRDLAMQLSSDFRADMTIVALDLGTPSANAELIERCKDLDIGLLVAAAGFGTSGDFADIAVGDELGMIDVNCRSVVELTHHFARRFKSQRRGGIVLMSSLVAFQGVPRAATYSATKAFIQSFAEGIRGELAPYQVDVLASAPGPVYSGFLKRANMTTGIGVTSKTVAQQTIAALGRHVLVRPGLISKLLEWALKPLPRRGRVWMMGIVMAGMTKTHTPKASHTIQKRRA